MIFVDKRPNFMLTYKPSSGTVKLRLQLYWLGSPYWTLPCRPAASNRPEPRHPEGPVDAGRGDQEPAELRDPHHPLQAGGPLGGRQRPQPDARPRQQDHLHLPHEVQLLPTWCSGVWNFHVTKRSISILRRKTLYLIFQSVCLFTFTPSPSPFKVFQSTKHIVVCIKKYF